MSYDNEKLTLYIHYGGLLSKKGKNICYKGGSTAPNMLVDPDSLTFSIFEDFTNNPETVSNVEKDKDNEIMKMAVEAKDCGEVYIYVEHSVSPPNVINDANLVTGACLDDGEKADDEGDSEEDDIDEEESGGENREEENDEEERDEECQKEDLEEEGAEDENQILLEGAADTRFADLFAEAEQQTTTVHGVATQPNVDDENGYDS
ncbi:PREDICTED: nucleosome assembly protein 1;2-like [Camelina sativa]|uniref:Nucleosome assembly protein 12-like n=1 Tax=Camelina sativa TaxID=90675 RepID=A0ABM0ZPD6_CAMSA|nr:PREDICTED: nucleosome assembly protein 1;2-like [Camelina sativa]